MFSNNVKIAVYIIWMLISAAIFGKSVHNEKMAWLSFPSMLSCIIAFAMWAITLIEEFLFIIQ